MTGVGLIIIGSTVNAIYREFMYFLSVDSFTPASCLVLIGFLIFAVALVGIYGTLRGEAVIIGVFGALLGLICVMQLGTGIVGYRLTESLEANLRDSMNNTIWSYPYDKYAAESMDSLQENMACCGMDSPRDWNEVNTTITQ